MFTMFTMFTMKVIIAKFNEKDMLKAGDVVEKTDIGGLTREKGMSTLWGRRVTPEAIME